MVSVSVAKWTFAVLTAVYAAVWLPSVYAYAWLAKRGNKTPDDADVPPPKFVWISILIIFLLFALFPVAYGINLTKPAPRTYGELVTREKVYVGASMIAKVSLHAVIGFAVIGQSATLDSVKFTGNTTKLAPSAKKRDDDNVTLRNILLTVGGVIVLVSVLTAWVVKRFKDASGLRGLNLLAFTVHTVSAAAILGTAVSEDKSLGRYRADYSLKFIRPEPWVLRCYNLTAGALIPEPAAKCPHSLDLRDTFTNQHRGSGPLNIAWFAFAFAAWSGLGHLVAAALVWHGRTFSQTLVKRLTVCRWVDYVVSAPLMLATLNIIFAATNLAGIFFAPALLAVLEIAAGMLEIDLLESSGWFVSKVTAYALLPRQWPDWILTL